MHTHMLDVQLAAVWAALIKNPWSHTSFLQNPQVGLTTHTFLI